MNELLERLIKRYLTEQIKIATNFSAEEVEHLVILVLMIQDMYRRGGKIFVFGNGGGASIADHFASDLSIHPFVSEDKRSVVNLLRLEVQCLNESPSLITRLGNDIGFNYIFVEQLRSNKLSARDMIIVFSTSGNSPNIVEAISYASKIGAYIVLIGGHKGGLAGEKGALRILVPEIKSKFPGQIGKNNNCFHIEDFQQSIAHIITGLFKEVING